jgi:hypothetical protein
MIFKITPLQMYRSGKIYKKMQIFYFFLHQYIIIMILVTSLLTHVF